MNDLISRKALIAEYDRAHVGPPGGARKLIEDAPAVDAVEVVHGLWILKETCGKNTEKFHCSVCNKIPKSLCTETYCPNCGAKMDLRSE